MILESPNLFIGIDGNTDNPILSLMNSGLICKQYKGDSYVCIYKNDTDYDFGFIRDYDVKELLDGKDWIDLETANKFLEYCGLTRSEYDRLPMVNKLYSLFQYFKVDNIMGKCIDPMDIKDATKLMEEFE